MTKVNKRKYKKLKEVSNKPMMKIMSLKAEAHFAGFEINDESLPRIRNKINYILDICNREPGESMETCTPSLSSNKPPVVKNHIYKKNLYKPDNVEVMDSSSSTPVYITKDEQVVQSNTKSKVSSSKSFGERRNRNATSDNTYLPQRNEDEPAAKIQKFSDDNDRTVLKLIITREGGTFKSRFKTNTTNDKEIGKQISQNNTSEYNNMECSYKHLEVIESINSSDTSNPDNGVDYLSTKDKITVKNLDFSDAALKVDNDTKNVISFVSTKDETTADDMDLNNKPSKIIESSSFSKSGKLHIRDMNKLIKPHLLENFYRVCFPKTANRDEKKMAVVPVNSISYQLKIAKQLTKNDIECLYHKYFNKSVEDNIVIIANILNILSHNHEKMNESFNIKSEVENHRVHCDSNRRIYLKHTGILESELKIYFLDIILQFSIPEFEPLFIIVFLALFKILLALDPPMFRNGRLFKNLIFLLSTSLKNTDFDHGQVFAMLMSEKPFRSDCVHVIRLIQNCRNSNSGQITVRMPLFFVSFVNSLEYFQMVMDSVTKSSTDDLRFLIDNAAIQYIMNSKFNNSMDLSSSLTVKKNINLKRPVSAIKCTSKSDDSIQHCVIPETLNGFSQPMFMNEPKSNNKSSKILKNGKAHQLNSSVVISTANAMSQIAVPNKTVASSPNVYNGSLKNGTIFVTSKPTLQTMPATISPLPQGRTFIIGNKQYTANEAPENQLQPITTRNNIAKTPILSCSANNCQRTAIIMCSKCKSVIYCSKKCQVKDWREIHIHKCDQMRHQTTTNRSNKY